MVAYNMEVKNTVPILKDLLTAIRGFQVAEHVYVSRIPGDVRANPIPAGLNTLGLNESLLPEISNVLGIRSMTLSAPQDLDALSRLSVTLPAKQLEHDVWAFFKDDAVIEELQSLFRNCRTVAFDDWANMTGASLLWDGLLTDVIKPLGKNDLEFIFYLGNATKRLSFEVDEALDIISAFSRHGKVTLAMDDSEAVNLWKVLNGVNQESPLAEQAPLDLKRKYFSMFRTMDVAGLMIWSGNDVLFFSQEQQFVLSRKKVDASIEMAPDARLNYITGFSIGLLMQLDIAHCILLGLIVYASFGELKTCPEEKDLCDYIQRWIDDLEKPGSIQLYED